MRYHDKNTLCLEYDELVPDFLSISNYNKLRQRGRITVYGRGCLGNSVLIGFETLPEKIRDAVIKKYGDPYQYIVKQPLRDWVQMNRNNAAFDYYNSTYQLPNGSKLPESYRDKYTKAISYLHGIQYYTTDKTALKRDFNISMDAFWRIVADVLTAEEVDLPKRRERLTKVLNGYKKAGVNTPAGFELRIEKHRFGNDNSKKVKDQLAEDILMKLCAADNKHAAEVIASAYNLWAEENGRKTITPAAVDYRRRSRAHEIDLERYGKGAVYSKYSKQIKQHRPTAPLMLVNSDDNVLDLYFTETTYANGKKGVNRYYRPVMYVVMDCFNDYILGYAVGETVTIDLIKAAYRNAAQHVQELTGAPHIWHQIKSDKWSIDPKLEGTLATFFKDQAIFFPASVAQSKYIERAFGKPLHKVLKAFPNYSGANITARSLSARPNPDALQKRSKDFPDKAHAPKVVEIVINALRHGVVDGGKTRQQLWLDAFNTSEFCRTKAISYERKLQLFGIKHNPGTQYDAPRLKPAGLNFQLNKVKYSFDIPASYFPVHNNKPVEIYYDPADMNSVLVTDGKGLRFVAEAYQYQAPCVADMKEGSGEQLHERLEEKREIRRQMEEYVDSRDVRVERAKIDMESVLQAGVLTKAINHKAQKAIGGYTEPGRVLHMEVEPAKEWSIYDEM